MTISDIERLFWAHKGRLIDKWQHYLPIYERYFARFRNQSPTVLEIGVCHGGSLQLWKRYFGLKCHIIGVDIDPRCQEYEEDRITVVIGDQGKESFWREYDFAPDIVIDDGSHFLSDQTTSLRCLWPHLKPDGVYLVEDCHNERPEPPRDAGSIAHYPWVCVYEKTTFAPKRVVSGTPSRPLNIHEQEAYAEFLEV